MTLMLSGGLALAESQAEIASRENDEGKQLMYASQYAEASAKFRDAVEHAKEPKYFLNLCASLYQEGKFGEALTACASAEKNGPDPDLLAKIQKLAQRIKDDATKQGLDLHPVGGGGEGEAPPPPGPDATPPGPTPDGAPPVAPPSAQPVTYRPVVGTAPTAQLFAAARPDHRYTWALGIDFLAANAQFKGTDANDMPLYGATAGGVRFKADAIVQRDYRIGVEAYVGVTHVEGSPDNVEAVLAGPGRGLDVIDFGIGAYKHFCLPGASRLCITPLVGASVAAMSPVAQQYYDGLGLRGEVALSLALGSRQQHVLSVMVDANFYSASVRDSADGGAATNVGLDVSDTITSVAFGYTYRFNTPLGGPAFVTLE